MSITDANFVLAFKQGDSNALKELHNYYYRSLCYFAGNIILDRPQAEDIVAESLTKLWQVREGFEAVPAMKSFLYITTRNACIDYLRKKKKQDISQNELRYLTSKDVQLVDYGVLSADVLQELVKAIDELPPQCAEVFKAIFFENLSTSQVARKLNISNQNVLNQKAKAIRMMKAALAKKDMLPVALCCCLDLAAMMN